MPRRLALLLPLLTACSYSSLDDIIVPEVLSAAIAIDPAEPDALAAIDVALRLRGGKRASSVARLHRVVLEERSATPDPAELVDLDLGFPAGFDAFVGENQLKEVELANLGTHNADLATLCGQAVGIRVWLEDPDEADAWTLSPQAAVALTCAAAARR
jgi:hypothetical protein